MTELQKVKRFMGEISSALKFLSLMCHPCTSNLDVARLRDA